MGRKGPGAGGWDRGHLALGFAGDRADLGGRIRGSGRFGRGWMGHGVVVL